MEIEKKKMPQLVNEFLKMRQKLGELELFKEETMEAEERLKQFKLLFSSIEDLAYFCDAQGRIAYVNNAFVKLSGVAADDLVKRPFASLFAGDDSENAERTINATLRGENTRIELCFKDSNILCEYHNIPMRDEKSGIAGAMGIGRDISERRSELEKLNSHLSHLEGLLNEHSEELKKLDEKLKAEELKRKRAEHDLKKFEKIYNRSSRTAAETCAKTPKSPGLDRQPSLFKKLSAKA